MQTSYRCKLAAAAPIEQGISQERPHTMWPRSLAELQYDEVKVTLKFREDGLRI